MCGDPVTIGLLAASTALSTIGALRDAGAQANAAKANARVAEQQAQLQRDVGQFNVARERRLQRRALAQQVANAGSQGTALTGQPIDLLADSAKQAELDLQALRFDSEIKAQASDTEARFRRFEARQARNAGFFKAGTALLTGATKIAGSLDISNPTTGANNIRNVTPPIPRGNPFRPGSPGRGPSIRT